MIGGSGSVIWKVQVCIIFERNMLFDELPCLGFRGLCDSMILYFILVGNRR